jgi:hypothetical protein
MIVNNEILKITEKTVRNRKKKSEIEVESNGTVQIDCELVDLHVVDTARFVCIDLHE